MSPHPPALATLIAGARRVVRDRMLRTLGAAALALLPLVLLLAWLGGTAWARPGPGPLLLELLALAGVAALALGARRSLRASLADRTIAAAAEDRLDVPRGTLGGLLELQRGGLPAGTSAALAGRAEAQLAPLLAQQGPVQLAGALGEVWRRRQRTMLLALLAALGGVTLLGFSTPERSRAAWTPLLHPVRSLAPPPLPALEVAPGHAEVTRGAPLAVRVRAVGRDVVVLRWRLSGDVVQERTLAVLGDSARGEIPSVDAAGSYWVEAPDGARSAHFRVQPIDALLLAELAVDVVYPAYLALPAEHHAGELPPLQVPAGTTLRIRGRATRPLRSAALLGAGTTGAFTVHGDRFEGRWTPQRSGIYAWALRADRAQTAATAPAPIEIVLLVDQPPSVVVTFPGRDTVPPEDMRQPIAAEARDDHGLSAAAIVSWRVSSAGSREPDVETAIGVERAERALVRSVLDISARGLLPGDTLRYYVRVRDAAPAGQSGVSATYALRVPTAEDLRLNAREAARRALELAESLAADAADIARRTNEAERRASAANARRGSRGGAQPGSAESSEARLQFAETETARALQGEQERMLERVEQLRESMAALEKSMAQAGLRDAGLQQKLEEMRQLMERLATPELQRELERLQQSLSDLDPERMQQALARLAEQQQDLQAQLDRQLEQLRRAAAEQELGALAQQARELETQQRALAREHEQPRAAGEQAGRPAEAQRRLAERSGQLAAETRALGERLERAGEEGAAAEAAGAAGRTRAAEEAMRDAARAAGEQRRRDAASSGTEAAGQLGAAAEQLDQARSTMGEAGREQARDGMEQATRDALALAQRQLELQKRMERGGAEESAGSPSMPAPPRPGAGGEQRGQAGSQAGARPGGQPQQGQGGTSPRQGGEQGGQRSGGAGSAQGAEGARSGAAGPPSTDDLAQMRSEQGALQQGLDQLGENVRESGSASGMVNRDVDAALGRAGLAMQQTQAGLEQAGQDGRLPAEQAARSVDALNRLALALLENAQQLEQAQSGGSGGRAREQLADLANAQAGVNGQSAAMLPLSLSPSSGADEARRLGTRQQQIAQQLAGMNDLPGGREDVMGELDLLAKEADALARELQGGRLPPEVIARQQRLFHRLLDAGRALEREETSEEREAERPGPVAPSRPPPLDPALLDDPGRVRPPTPEELRALPPAYRRLILDYFERLNRPLPPAVGTPER